MKDQKNSGNAASAEETSGQSEMGEGRVRVSIRLSPQAKEAVEAIMRLAGIDTIQDAVRRALSDELFLLKERKDGWNILLQKGSKYREVRWPDFD